MARVRLLLLLFGALVAFASATAPTFCKCTCFKNSTIILLGPQFSSHPPAPHAMSSSPTGAGGIVTPRSASASCTQCTKAFCLENRIPFCADATEEDVATQCFQRDSLKDKTIVWGFLLGTSALMGYAAYKRLAEWRAQREDVFSGGPGRGEYTVLEQGATTPARFAAG